MCPARLRNMSEDVVWLEEAKRTVVGEEFRGVRETHIQQGSASHFKELHPGRVLSREMRQLERCF